MRKFSQRSLDALNGVHPDLIRVFTRALQSSPYDFIVTEGLRTKTRQQQLFASGASRTLNSRHLHGLALDVWAIDPTTGKAVPGGKAGDKRHWELLPGIAEAVKAEADYLGVEIGWGGEMWPTFKDGVHFELLREVYPDGMKYDPIDPMAIAPSAEPQEVKTMPDTVKIEEGPQKAVAGAAAVYVLDMLREMGIDLGPLAPILESNTGMALIVGGIVWYIANSKRKVIE